MYTLIVHSSSVLPLTFVSVVQRNELEVENRYHHFDLKAGGGAELVPVNCLSLWNPVETSFFPH
jgi:hypothetical protein